MTEIMAISVGNNGHVYAVDISEQQIEIARQRIKDIGNKLATICQNLNIFSKIEYYTSSYDFNGHKQLLLDRYEEFKDKAVLARLITEEESLALREKLHLFFNSEELKKMNLKIDQHHLLLTCKIL